MLEYNAVAGTYHTQIVGTRFVGIHPVLFGYRVKSGYVGSFVYEIEYCCGNSPAWLSIVYSYVLAQLNKGFPYEKFPREVRRPTQDDPLFRAVILDKVAGLPQDVGDIFTSDDLSEMTDDVFDKLTI